MNNMKREIKFRFWYKEENRMVVPDDEEWELFWSGTNNFSFAQVNTGTGDWNIKNEDVMQYTGLLDKNGNEIYEGDIFGVYSLTGDFAGTNEPRGKVIFDVELGAYCVEDVNGGWVYLSEYITKPRYEIIGNIYENSNLLSE